MWYQRSLIFLLTFSGSFLFFGCDDREEQVSMSECVVSCMEHYTKEYLDENYSTQDNFIDQFEKLCEKKAKSYKYCIHTKYIHQGYRGFEFTNRLPVRRLK